MVDQTNDKGSLICMWFTGFQAFSQCWVSVKCTSIVEMFKLSEIHHIPNHVGKYRKFTLNCGKLDKTFFIWLSFKLCDHKISNLNSRLDNSSTRLPWILKNYYRLFVCKSKCVKPNHAQNCKVLWNFMKKPNANYTKGLLNLLKIEWWSWTKY